MILLTISHTAASLEAKLRNMFTLYLCDLSLCRLLVQYEF